MIKTGIYGPTEPVSPLRKQLLRLLLRHPDIDLRSVACDGSAASGRKLADIHPVYTGETDLRLEPKLTDGPLDVIFVIDRENLTDEILDRFHSDPNLRIIALGYGDDMRRNMPGGFEYGFAEWNRKVLVRGARAAVSPTPQALLLETALFPLAKNFMLGDEVDAIITGRSEEAKVAEAERTLSAIQGGKDVRIMCQGSPEATFQRIDLRVSMESNLSVEEVKAAYDKAYEDHSFVYTVAGSDGIEEDLRGSNKCLLQIYRTGSRLNVNATMDTLTRGTAGNAVHLMNLLFGLHERTGLSI